MVACGPTDSPVGPFFVRMRRGRHAGSAGDVRRAAMTPPAPPRLPALLGGYNHSRDYEREEA